MLSASSAALGSEPSGLAHPCWPSLLLSAAGNSAQWPALLGYLARSLGYSQAALVETGEGFRDPVALCFHKDQVSRLFEGDPARRALEGRNARPGDIFFTHHLVKDEFLVRDAFYQRHLAPRNWHYGFWLTLLADERLVHLTMWRPRASGPGAPEELEPLLDHLASVQLALRIGAHAERQQSTHATLARAAERLPHGYVLLTRGLRIEFLNEQARRVLDGHYPLQISEDRLSATDPAQQSQVVDFLSRAFHPVRQAGRPRVLRMRRPDGKGDLWLHPERVDAGRGLRRRDGAGLALTLITADAGAPVRAELLESLFHLSAAEARVAAQVGAGLSIAEAAECSGTKQLTAKSQLSQVYRKLGINRQSELVMLLVRLTGL